MSLPFFFAATYRVISPTPSRGPLRSEAQCSSADANAQSSRQCLMVWIALARLLTLKGAETFRFGAFF